MKAGDTFGGCTIECQCGFGAYGIVYLAKDALGRTVAIKVFHSRWNETHKLDGLRKYMATFTGNEGMLRLYHFGVEDEHFFYVMDAADNATPEGDEYTPDTLAYRLATRKRLPLDEALSLCHSLLDAVEKLHALEMVHRDLKPENVVYVNGRPQIGDLDFLSSYNLTMSLVGTLGYIPPEFTAQRELPKTASVDLYALGKIFYCCVTGNLPEAYPRLPKDLPEETLFQVCVPLTRLCSKNPALRPRNCQEFRSLLQEWSRENKNKSLGHHFAFYLALYPPLKYWLMGAVTALFLVFITILALHPEPEYWIGFGCVVLVLIAIAATVVCRRKLRSWQQARAELLREKQSAVAEMQLRIPLMEKNLDSQAITQLTEMLAQAATIQSPGKMKRIDAVLDDAKALLAQQAATALPVPLESMEGTKENILRCGASFGYLHSVLARSGMSHDEWNALREKLLADGKALCPDFPIGSNLLKRWSPTLQYDFVPPGKTQYPFWIMSEDVSSELFSNRCGYKRFENEAHPGMVTKVCPNDMMAFSHAIMDFLADRNNLPPGYIVRMPTVQELEWYLEFTALGGLDYEVRHDKVEKHPMDLAAFTDDSFTKLVRYNYPASEHHIDIQPDKMICMYYTFRVVIAPGNASFYKDSYVYGAKILSTERDGKIYAGYTTCHSRCSHLVSREVARAVNAKLFEPTSAEECRLLFHQVNGVNGFPTLVGAEYRDGAWRRLSDNVALDWKELPENVIEERNCLTADERRFIGATKETTTPGVIFQWDSREQWEHRGDILTGRVASAPCIARRVTANERHFLLVKLELASYAVEPFCRYMGARVAVIPDQETQKEVRRQLADVDGKIALGAIRFYGYANSRSQWRWHDGTIQMFEIEAGYDVRNMSPMLDCLAIQNGKLVNASFVQYILLEVE